MLILVFSFSKYSILMLSREKAEINSLEQGILPGPIKTKSNLFQSSDLWIISTDGLFSCRVKNWKGA